MSREFKPGDVALWAYKSAEDVGLRVKNCPVDRHNDDRSGGHWHLAAGGWTADPDVDHFRPLVVIDPEDREQVVRLVEAFRATAHDDTMTDMQAALRSLIESPKPEEPTGLGAVVEDASGMRWTRANAAGEWFAHDGNDVAITFDEVPAVRVLNEGVTS